MTVTPPSGTPITVVLLNYNGSETVLRCIRSLQKQAQPPERIIFIDNGSAEYNEAAFRFAFGPRFNNIVRYVRLEKNVGYANGMNAGLKMVLADETSPDWVMTLSNDTELDPEFFQNLDLALEGLAPAGGPMGTTKMLAPKLRSAHDRELLDGAGIGVSLDGMSTARGQRERDENQYDSDVHILIPNGTAAMYRVDLLKEVGLLDESFDAYCEDTDLGLRAWLAGWDCHFLADCIVYHARSATLGEHSLNKLYLVERNHYWVAVKNLPLPLLLMVPTFSIYRYLLQTYALLARRGQGRGFGEGHSAAALAWTTLKGVTHAGLGLPAAFLKRVRSYPIRRRTMLETLYTLWRKRLPFAQLILK
ncbi:MAG: glycosyltransferase family 2 protein [Deltaproteobacteria bacterium]|nr:glycosyltransferase family 2 protein [Deltaproteobacteria bacterium]